ncbi:hypothetical protein ACFOWB_25155 [Chenggangzhangella methanolivorans]|uniref:hypothetical protein n=1 Tax=Chenggangzhangella methanolivorans TaxID=1437009 RepID=UPI0036163B5C
MTRIFAALALACALAGCSAKEQRLWGAATPIISAIIAPAPAPKPEGQRKARRSVTKD